MILWLVWRRFFTIVLSSKFGNLQLCLLSLYRFLFCFQVIKIVFNHSTSWIGWLRLFYQNLLAFDFYHLRFFDFELNIFQLNSIVVNRIIKHFTNLRKWIISNFTSFQTILLHWWWNSRQGPKVIIYYFVLPDLNLNASLSNLSHLHLKYTVWGFLRFYLDFFLSLFLIIVRLFKKFVDMWRV
jgi:hypothetical protein